MTLSKTIPRNKYCELRSLPTITMSDDLNNMLKSEEYIMVGDVLTLERAWVAVSGSTRPIVFTERRSCPSGSWATHTNFRIGRAQE